MKKVTWVSSDASRKERRDYERESAAMQAAYARKKRTRKVVTWIVTSLVIPFIVAFAAAALANILT